MLVDAYSKAKEAGIEVGPLRQSQLAALRRALTSIQNEVMYSNTIIDMLLVNTAGKPTGDPDLESLSVQACINEAVARFPFNNDRERSLVHVKVDQDFMINGPRLLIVHVLFNLIKNALQYVQRSQDAWVEISAVDEGDIKKIVIYDNGPGIPLHDLPHIFERFYTTNRTGQGAGIGLSFCKSVMESIGGSITCDTREGEFTRFTLIFHNHQEIAHSPQTRVNTLGNLHGRSAS
jgi:two-component system CAI-1 autoinducer sensor kinase/phosphatase CqsS